MLSVTTTAKKKLKQDLVKIREDLAKTREDQVSLIRIAPSSEGSANIGFLLDTEKEGDNVIMDNEGDKLLLIDNALAQLLSGKVLDLEETDNGLEYTITSE